MLIVKIVGGLGNQMFQYAMAKALSLKFNVKLKIDCCVYNNRKYINNEGYLLKKVFNIPENEAQFSDYIKTLGFSSFLMPLLRRNKYIFLYRNKIIIEKKIFHYDEALLQKRILNGYIAGYWQSQKYFLKYQNYVFNSFNFNNDLLSKRSKYFAQIINDKNSVALHIRRGDYISNNIYSEIYKSCDVNYYKTAIKIIESKLNNPHFFIFTDDIFWAMSQPEFFDKTYFTICSNGDESWNDLYLMSNCKHHIIANSSFSWWGAWLSRNDKKIVISPSIWFKKNNRWTICYYL
jgi:hypothetical protein